MRLGWDAELAAADQASGEKSLMLRRGAVWLQQSWQEKEGLRALGNTVKVSNAMRCLIHMINLFFSILGESQC